MPKLIRLELLGGPRHTWSRASEENMGVSTRSDKKIAQVLQKGW